jgi:hypothetical protein
MEAVTNPPNKYRVKAGISVLLQQAYVNWGRLVDTSLQPSS